MKHFLLTLALFGLSLSAFSQSSSSKFYISLNNGDTLYGSSVELKEPFLAKSYLQFNVTEKYNLSEVKAFGNEDGEFIYANVKNGLSKKILKKEITGKINLYSRLVTTYSGGGFNGAGGYTPGFYSTSEKLYLHNTTTNTIETLNFTALKARVADNPRSMKKIKEVQDMRTISGILYVVGSSLIIYDMARAINNSSSGSTDPYTGMPSGGNSFTPVGLLLGGVAVTIPLFMTKTKKRKMKEAVLLYNQ